MANAFVSEFESYNAPLIHLPLLLSELHRETYFANVPKDRRFFLTKCWHWLIGRYRPGHAPALAVAREAVVTQVLEWDDNWNISSLDAVCFSQPHGHKRTAMFTAFAMSMYALRTRDAVFTTDSDTLIQNNGLDEMLTLLRSSPYIGGVTADVKIWNRAESLLTRLCAARYWLAFNIERACQSMWGCVGCLSGPMSMYRTSDLETILGPWNLQTFGGKATTFGDDRTVPRQHPGRLRHPGRLGQGASPSTRRSKNHPPDRPGQRALASARWSSASWSPNWVDTWTGLGPTPGPTSRSPPSYDPYQMFARMYGHVKDREDLKSVLDGVQDDLKKVGAAVSAEDRRSD